MYMTSSLLLLCVLVIWAEENRTCPEQCMHCVNDFCLRCHTPYYGWDCDNTCPKHCKDGYCTTMSACILGCESGWYGMACEEQCVWTCKDGTCDRQFGRCLYSVVEETDHSDTVADTCDGGECSNFCPDNCQDDDKYMSIEGVLLIVAATSFLFVTCFCCLWKHRVNCSSDTSSQKNVQELEIIPRKQQLISGHAATSFTSSNIVHSFQVPDFEMSM